MHQRFSQRNTINIKPIYINFIKLLHFFLIILNIDCNLLSSIINTESLSGNFMRDYKVF